MYKIVRFCVFASAILMSIALSAQAPKPRFRKNIFAELGGNGLLFSGNYDMRLKRGAQDGLGFRIGLGGGRIINDAYFTIPFGVNYLLGAGRSALEVGLGLTPAHYRSSTYSNNALHSMDKWYGLVMLNIGYRFQPLRDGVMFRIDWTPGLNGDRVVRGYAGLSLGISSR